MLLDATIGPAEILKQYYNLFPMEDITMKMHWEETHIKYSFIYFFSKKMEQYKSLGAPCIKSTTAKKNLKYEAQILFKTLLFLQFLKKYFLKFQLLNKLPAPAGADFASSCLKEA